MLRTVEQVEKSGTMIPADTTALYYRANSLNTAYLNCGVALFPTVIKLIKKMGSLNI